MKTLAKSAASALAGRDKQILLGIGFVGLILLAYDVIEHGYYVDYSFEDGHGHFSLAPTRAIS